MTKKAPSPDPDAAAEGATSAEPGQASGKKRKLMFAGAGAAALLLAAGGGAWAFLGSGGGEKAGEHAETAPDASDDGGAESAEGAAGSLIDVPAIVTNMRRGGSESGYLKLRFMLVAASPEKAEKVKTRLPAIIDRFQPFLRELRPEDLNGAAAVYRIKEELLFRCKQVVGPDMVEDLLIQDLLQQ